MLEEDRILEQQHLEAEQNRKTLMKHELVKRRSTLKQVWFEFLEVFVYYQQIQMSLEMSYSRRKRTGLVRLSDP